MDEIKVECYSGYRADQRPLRFVLGGKVLLVREIEDQWYSAEAIYFRVLADDDNYYILRHDEAADRWALEAFRAGAQRNP